MTRKELMILRNMQATQKKIGKAKETIFKYLEDEGFSIAEARFLFTEMGQALDKKQRFDPLRKLTDLKDPGYSASFKDLLEQFSTEASAVFAETAASYASSYAQQ